MMTKHFFKSVVLFTGMILLGLLGVFLVSYFNIGEEAPTAAPCKAGETC